MLHLFIAAYIRVVSQLPGLNRFVSGQRIYARNEILINMMVKRGITTESEETCAKVVFEPTDTIYDVYRKMNEAVEEIRASDDSGTEKVAGVLMKMPRLILKFAVWIIKLLDYFDLLPMSLLRVSPFHGSMIVTDLGSLGIPPIYHHLYNFGNLPVFLAFGAKRRVVELDRHGQPVEHKYVDYKIVCDERIVDGAYYAGRVQAPQVLPQEPLRARARPGQGARRHLLKSTARPIRGGLFIPLDAGGGNAVKYSRT